MFDFPCVLVIVAENGTDKELLRPFRFDFYRLPQGGEMKRFRKSDIAQSFIRLIMSRGRWCMSEARDRFLTPWVRIVQDPLLVGNVMELQSYLSDSVRGLGSTTRVVVPLVSHCFVKPPVKKTSGSSIGNHAGEQYRLKEWARV